MGRLLQQAEVQSTLPQRKGPGSKDKATNTAHHTRLGPGRSIAGRGQQSGTGAKDEEGTGVSLVPFVRARCDGALPGLGPRE